MNDAQLRCFHVAAQEQSITRAAARLGISQPTVSTQIKILEEGYGVQLFRRVGRKIELTDFGLHLMAITERIYAAQEEARELLIGHKNLSQGRLRIGAVGPYQALPILQELRLRHPDVTFSLRTGNSSAIFDALMKYDIDIGIMADLKAGDSKFHIQLLRRDEIGLLAPRQHRFATQEAVAMSALTQETLIIREQGSVTRSTFLSALQATDLPLPALIDVESREATKEAVACGFGLAPVLRSEAGHDPRTVFVPLEAPAPGFDEFVACPRDLVRLPLIRAFLDAARDVCDRLEAGRTQHDGHDRFGL